MAIAVIFPGQGSQAPGFGLPWHDHPAWRLVERAEAETGRPLAHLLTDATADELADTRAAQLSVLMGSLLAWEALEATLDPGEIVGVAGHSLGQITALIAAGAVSPVDGFALAVARADASAAAQAESSGGLLALLGTDEATAVAACTAGNGQAWVANVNGAGQVVVGGSTDVLDAVAERASELGVRRTRRLAVGGAFHTPLMTTAAEQFAPALARTAFSQPRFPIVTNHDAVAVTEQDGWPDRLTTHLVEPVRWADGVQRLIDLGADTFVEVGPGSTLSALVRRIAPQVEVRAVATPADLDVAVAR